MREQMVHMQWTQHFIFSITIYRLITIYLPVWWGRRWCPCRRRRPHTRTHTHTLTHSRLPVWWGRRWFPCSRRRPPPPPSPPPPETCAPAAHGRPRSTLQWSNTSGQTPVVKHQWSNTSGQTPVVKHPWSNSGQTPVVKYQWSNTTGHAHARASCVTGTMSP